MVTFKETHKAITRTVHVHSATFTVDEAIVADLVRAHISQNIIPNHFDPVIIKEKHLKITRAVHTGGYHVELDIEVEEDE